MFEPDRLTAALNAVAGGLLFALWHAATQLMSGQPMTAADYVRVVGNVVCAILAGVLMAWALTAPLTKAIPFDSLRDPTAVAFVIGALAWELLPVLYMVARKRAAKLGDSQ